MRSTPLKTGWARPAALAMPGALLLTMVAATAGAESVSNTPAGPAAPAVNRPHAGQPAVTVTPRGGKTELVFAFTHHVGFGLQRNGDTLALHFTRGGDIPGSGGDGAPTVHGGVNGATVDLPRGARVRTERRGNGITVSVLTPASVTGPGIDRRPAAASPAAVQSPGTSQPSVAPAAGSDRPSGGENPIQPPGVPLPAIPASAAPAIAAPASSAPASAATNDPTASSPTAAPGGPQPLLSMHTDASASGDGAADAVLTFSSQTGAAAFRRGGMAWVVFDERRQIDSDTLQSDPLFAHATIQSLQAATLLRIPLEPDRELRLTHTGTDWVINAVSSAPPPLAIGVLARSNRLELPAVDTSQVVTVPDPETGQNLLVGTLRGAPAGIPVARAMPAFVLQPTWQGVVVEPIADTTILRTTKDGFTVEAAGEPLSPAPDATKALAEAAFLTRRFEIPTGPADMLMRRLQAQIDEAGAAPAQSRARPRKAAAATLIALGLGVEAQAMLNLAAEEDPRLLRDADAAGLTAIAAMLGGRGAEADTISDPALTGSDEVAFWRAVHAAQSHEGAPEAAAVFASTVKLLLAYPARLRDALLPLAAETMALGGMPDAADALLAIAKDDQNLDLARAIRLEAKGNTAEALAIYDALATGRDRLTGARAASRATLLRLKTNAITPAAAADALENQFLNWRGDERELDLRLRVAALRTQSGAWRPAFALLRETAAMYPDSAPVIQARMADLMTALVSGPASATISPLELVTLTEENAELVAAVAPAKAAGLMADKLVALDLPRRAGPVIERMMHAAPIGVAQATLGARLAAMRLAEGDDAGAQTALANSNAPACRRPWWSGAASSPPASRPIPGRWARPWRSCRPSARPAPTTSGPPCWPMRRTGAAPPAPCPRSSRKPSQPTARLRRPSRTRSCASPPPCPARGMMPACAPSPVSKKAGWKGRAPECSAC